MNAESGRRDDETRKLNDLIVRSRRAEEQWRQAYVESRKGRRPDDTPVSIDSVGEAVALAREAFPDRLLIKLNSRSNENTPFTNPAEVYDALAWLATAHCDGNDDRIGEACSGWTCKTSQREESIAKYREWYETLADGKTCYLGAHIGKGTLPAMAAARRQRTAIDDELFTARGQGGPTGRPSQPFTMLPRGAGSCGPVQAICLHSADTAAIAYPAKPCKLLILLEPASGLEPLTC